MVPTSQKKDALSRSHVPFPIIIEILSLKKKARDTRGLKLSLARTMNPKRYHLVLCISNYHAIQYFRPKIGQGLSKKALVSTKKL